MQVKVTVTFEKRREITNSMQWGPKFMGYARERRKVQLNSSKWAYLEINKLFALSASIMRLLSTADRMMTPNSISNFWKTHT